MVDLEEVLEKFSDKRIIVLGDIMLDKFTQGKIRKLNPEQPTSMNIDILEGSDSYFLGGAANVANNLASLGARCRLYGAIGADAEGEKIKELCEKERIDFVPFIERKRTNMKWRTIAHGQQTQRMNFGEREPPVGNKIENLLLEKLKKDLEKANFLILSDYDKGFFTQELSQKIIELANKKGIPTHIDFRPKNINYFKGGTIISPNEQEAEEITGLGYLGNGDTLEKMSKILIEKTGAKYSIITCGEDGVYAFNSEKNESFMVPAKAIEVYDVTGAGDTFAASLPLGLASGMDLFEAVKLANYASAVVVRKRGTATATPEEILKKILFR